MSSASAPAGAPPVRLFYFRHGETLWSLAGQHTGVTDIALTANGEAQARALRPWVQAVSFAHVLTSPRLRARKTCELAGVGDGAKIDPDLAEWNYGDYEGRRSAEILQERPDWNLFRDGCPNGETPEEMSQRVDRVIERLRELGGDIALFSHGHFGAVLGARWIGLPVAEGEHFALAPASMSVLGQRPNHPETSVISLWNAAAGPTASALPIADAGRPTRAPN